MIKFFRRIRQNLLKENKTGKYFKYAIGEIVLVVIGILIALQINNANENRLLNKVRQNYYNQLIIDLDNEIKDINIQIIRLGKSIATYDTYSEYIRRPNLKSIDIINALAKVNITFEFLSFNSNTIETLESTGDITLMGPVIRNKLIDLKRQQEFLIKIQSSNDDLYLIDLNKAMQLGFGRIVYIPSTITDLKIDNNFNEIILTLEAGLMIKNFTEKDKVSNFKEMINKLKELKILLNKINK